MKFNSGDIITEEVLDQLNLNDYWKMVFKSKQTNDDLTILKEQYLKVKQDIKERFQDMIEKFNKGTNFYPMY
jgi:hypothetical protein